MRQRLRRGHLLAEALCALALAGLLAAAAGLSLTGARRSLQAAERRDRAERAERDAVAILREVLEEADGIVLRGDTAVDLDLLVGTGVVCGVEPFAVLLPPPSPRTGDALTVLTQPLGAEDVVSVRVPDAGPDEEWWFGVIDSVQQRVVPGVCDVASGWRAASDGEAALTRIVLLDSVPAAVAVGSPVRLARRGRFTLYHAGRGEWMLGWRRCHPWLDVCGVVQPVAGPLRTPAAEGLRFVVQADPAGIEIRATGANGGRGATALVHQ